MHTTLHTKVLTILPLFLEGHSAYSTISIFPRPSAPVCSVEIPEQRLRVVLADAASIIAAQTFLLFPLRLTKAFFCCTNIAIARAARTVHQAQVLD